MVIDRNFHFIISKNIQEMVRKILLRNNEEKECVTETVIVMTSTEEERFVALLEEVAWVDKLQKRDALILINHGCLFFNGLLTEFKKSPYIGKSNGAFLELLNRASEAGKKSVENFTCSAETLTEILIELLREAFVDEKFIQSIEKKFGFT